MRDMIKPVREITTHRVNPANDVLVIKVLDEPGPGGASHSYQIEGFSSATNPSNPPNVPGDGIIASLLLFQNGAINEAGVNGITHEALIAILIDRLTSFQLGPYSCQENQLALAYLTEAQAQLNKRTRKRMERSVEGTMEK